MFQSDVVQYPYQCLMFLHLDIPNLIGDLLLWHNFVFRMMFATCMSNSFAICSHKYEYCFEDLVGWNLALVPFVFRCDARLWQKIVKVKKHPAASTSGKFSWSAVAKRCSSGKETAKIPVTGVKRSTMVPPGPKSVDEGTEWHCNVWGLAEMRRPREGDRHSTVWKSPKGVRVAILVVTGIRQSDPNNQTSEKLKHI